MDLNETNLTDPKEAWVAPELIEGCVKENTQNATQGGPPDGMTEAS